GYNLNGDRID
uniref:Sperm-activating peptide (Tyr-2, Asn-3, Asp-7,10, Arg-8, Ile-9 SAP-I) n=1 Tax=Echinometra mathaei TaxID=31178 RepID=Q7M4C2_ECHMA|nr:sperm-activating peptide I (2-Tyr,3-Asn,7,10-Asp,8-Arg,9-Ile [Echinometra mathaei]